MTISRPLTRSPRSARLDGPLGAEVIAFDLSGGLEPASVREVVDAVYRHQLLLFRGQQLSPAQRVAFARCFGELHADRGDISHPNHPEIGQIGPARNVGADYWHTDGLFRAEPPSVTVLYARQLPAEGGDTLFVDAYAAYELLPQPIRRVIESRRMIHGDDTGHPMVRTHPVTRRRALYLDLMVYRSRIEGMASREKEALIRQLIAHVERPGAVYRHQWREGDLLVWDNASVLHRGTEIPTGQPPHAPGDCLWDGACLIAFAPDSERSPSARTSGIRAAGRRWGRP